MDSSRFFLRLLTRSLWERIGRVTVAVLTVGLGTSVIGAFLTLYADVRNKVSLELREAGGNFVIRPAEGVESLPEAAANAVTGFVPAGSVRGIQPFVYDVVELKDRRLAAAGVQFGSIKTVTPYWLLLEPERARAPGQDECLLGKTVAEKLNVQWGDVATLRKGERTHSCLVGAFIESGGAEDDQVFLPLPQAQRLFGRTGQLHLVLVNLLPEGVDVEALARGVEKAVPGSRAQPIRKLARSEARILDRIQSIVRAVVAFIAASSLLGLLIALMAMLTERRREAALMTVLGATGRRLSLHLLAETGIIGLVGGFVGIILGAALAESMERTMFGTSMRFRPGVIPIVLALSVLFSLAGAILPLRQARKIQPAAVLKGE